MNRNIASLLKHASDLFNMDVTLAVNDKYYEYLRIIAGSNNVYYKNNIDMRIADNEIVLYMYKQPSHIYDVYRPKISELPITNIELSNISSLSSHIVKICTDYFNFEYESVVINYMTYNNDGIVTIGFVSVIGNIYKLCSIHIGRNVVNSKLSWLNTITNLPRIWYTIYNA